MLYMSTEGWVETGIPGFARNNALEANLEYVYGGIASCFVWPFGRLFWVDVAGRAIIVILLHSKSISTRNVCDLFLCHIIHTCPRVISEPTPTPNSHC
jgi:hypothetical protein